MFGGAEPFVQFWLWEFLETFMWKYFEFGPAVQEMSFKENVYARRTTLGKVFVLTQVS